MRKLARKSAALAVAVAAATPLLVVAPARAQTVPTQCQAVPFETPWVDVDLDNDGNPEYRVPSISDVEVCLGGDVYLTDSPSVEVVRCSWFASCFVVLIHVGFAGGVDTDVSLCYSLDGVPTCRDTNMLDFEITHLTQPRTICIGFDMQGGFPCSGHAVTLE